MKISLLSKTLLLCFVNFSTAACIKLGYDGSNSVSSSPSPPPFPATFPTDLIAKTTGDCGSGTLLFTRILTDGILLFMPGDTVLTGEMDIEMSPNGTYLAIYREFDIASTETFRQTLNGTFFYNSQTGHVSFSNFGVGALNTDDGHYLITIQPTVAINAPLLTSRILDFRSKKSIDGLTTTRAQYCSF